MSQQSNQPTNFDQGDLVVIEAKDFFRGKKAGAVIGICKDHDGGTLVELLDPSASIRKVCVRPERGDTIVHATKPL